MKYLFDYWSDVEKLIKSQRKVAILCDYDGTLTPIVSKPELALLSEDMKDLLYSLAHHSRFTLVIITGRTLNDIKNLVGIEEIYYVGNHGLEVEGPSLTLQHPGAVKMRPVIAQICQALRSQLDRVPGVVVEDKGLSASLHYRLVPKGKISVVKKILNTATRNLEKVKITQGKKVFEIRPDVAWDKGRAARWFLKTTASFSLPVYLGDDQTDEDAFKALKDGITILVSTRKKPSNANFFVKGNLEVQEFFRRLVRL